MFDANSLAQFNRAENLTLRSYTSIDFYTGINFGAAGLRSVTLDAAALVGRSTGSVVLNGDTMVLRNSSGSFIDPLVADQGNAGAKRQSACARQRRQEFSRLRHRSADGTQQHRRPGRGSLNAGTATVRLFAPLITEGEARHPVDRPRRGGSLWSSPAARTARELRRRTAWARAGGGGSAAASVDFGGRVDRHRRRRGRRLRQPSGDVAPAIDGVIHSTSCTGRRSTT